MEYFFSLFSLSKSATNGALNWSELALLLFGIVLVMGLVGEYRTLDQHSRHMKVCELLVIVGVLGELLGDGGVFLFSHQLQVISDSEIREANDKALDAKNSAEAAAGAAARAIASSDAAIAKSASANSLATDADSKAKDVARQTVKLEQQANALDGRIRQAKAFADMAFARTRPRAYRMDGEKFIEALKAVPPCNVEVLYKPEDEEAYALASKIVRLLGNGRDAGEAGLGWNVSGPLPLGNQARTWAGSEKDIPPTTMTTGAGGGFSFGGGFVVREIPDIEHPNSPARKVGVWAISAALDASGIHFAWISGDGKMPPNLIRVVVLSQFD